MIVQKSAIGFVLAEANHQVVFRSGLLRLPRDAVGGAQPGRGGGRGAHVV
jgi:hypothetical protein